MGETHPVVRWLLEEESNPDLSLRMTLFHVSNSFRFYLTRCLDIPSTHDGYWKQKCDCCTKRWPFHHKALWIYSGLGAAPAPKIPYVPSELYVSMIQPANLSGTQGWISSWIPVWELTVFFQWLMKRQPDQTITALVKTIWHNLKRIGNYTCRMDSRFSTHNWRKIFLRNVHPRWTALFKNRHDIEVTALLEIGSWEPKPHPTRYPVIEPLRDHCPPDLDNSAPKRQRVDTFTG